MVVSIWFSQDHHRLPSVHSWAWLRGMGGPEGGASLKDPTTTALKIEVARLEELERSARRIRLCDFKPTPVNYFWTAHQCMLPVYLSSFTVFDQALGLAKGTRFMAEMLTLRTCPRLVVTNQSQRHGRTDFFSTGNPFHGVLTALNTQLRLFNHRFGVLRPGFPPPLRTADYPTPADQALRRVNDSPLPHF